VQDVVRGRGGRAVGAFDDDAGARVARALDGELAFERGGDEELALEAPELLGVDRCGAGEALQAAVRGGVRERGGDVDAGLVHQDGGVVGDRDHARAGVVEHARADAADVAEALHDHARALDRQAQMAGGLARGDEHAAAGGFLAAQAAAERDRLAGDDAGGGAAAVHREGVHHDRHRHRVGADVGRRDVLVRADDDADLGGVAARDALQLALADARRVDADAALGAAEGQADRGVLDRHPAGQRHHLVEGDVGVEAHAALARAARQVVLHAVALVVGDGAVVDARSARRRSARAWGA
jgi:hypothetical protein